MLDESLLKAPDIAGPCIGAAAEAGIDACGARVSSVRLRHVEMRGSVRPISRFVFDNREAGNDK